MNVFEIGLRTLPLISASTGIPQPPAIMDEVHDDVISWRPATFQGKVYLSQSSAPVAIRHRVIPMQPERSNWTLGIIGFDGKLGSRAITARETTSETSSSILEYQTLNDLLVDRLLGQVLGLASPPSPMRQLSSDDVAMFDDALIADSKLLYSLPA